MTLLNKTSRLKQEIYKARFLYLMLLPGIIFYIIFLYGPMPGLILAFKKFNFVKGIFGSSWIGFENFRAVFSEPSFYRAFKNTIIISFSKIIFIFPVPIIIALMINEIRMKKFSKTIQTIYTFPHFLSWIVISGIVINLLGSNGAVNKFLLVLGMEPKRLLADATIFRPMLYFLDAWKEAGWSSIIYLAALTTIDPGLYEAADIDGATRMQKIRHITLPNLYSMITILLILQIGQVMNAGFMQILNLYNPTVMSTGDILDTYVYRITFQRPPDFGYSTAVGMFKSVINFTLVFFADRLAKKMGQTGIF